MLIGLGGLGITLTILFTTEAVIQHFSLRVVLCLNGYAPWNYARFLDYATDRLFLQRVGGKYRFIHRLLQEHFAQHWQPEIELLFVTDSEKQVKKWDRKSLKDAEVYNDQGIAYYYLKKHQQAIKDYTQTIKLNPQDAKAFYNRGNAYKNLKDYQQAIKDYTQAIKLNPKDTDAYASRGIVSHKLGNYTAALSDYQKVLTLNETNRMQTTKVSSF